MVSDSSVTNDSSLSFSPAADRNKKPILEVIVPWLERSARVLEIAAGTGQHAVYFATEMPHLEWQPTDLAEQLDKLKARCDLHGPENLRRPIVLDANDPEMSIGGFDAVYIANGLQIMPREAFEKLSATLPELTTDDAQVVLYGPLRYEDREFEPSNQQFDRMLHGRAPHMGVRSFEWVRDTLLEHGFGLSDDVEMPANNHLLRFRREV